MCDRIREVKIAFLLFLFVLINIATVIVFDRVFILFFLF